MSEDYQEQKAQLAGLYSQVSPTYDEVGPPVFAHFGRRLVELSKIEPGEKVLDVAAGKGAVLFPAAERVGASGKVIGIDLSAEMVAETRRRIEEVADAKIIPAEIHEMDAEKLEYPDSTFDSILCGFALFFFPRREQALVGFRRVLNPDGRISVSTWARGTGFMAWLDETLEEHLPSQISRQESEDRALANRPSLKEPEGLKAALEQAGFVDVRVVEEEHDFVYKDREEVWRSLWTHGVRGALKKMDGRALAAFRAAFDERMIALQREDGVHILLEVLYGLGTRK